MGRAVCPSSSTACLLYIPCWATQISKLYAPFILLSNSNAKGTQIFSPFELRYIKPVCFIKLNGAIGNNMGSLRSLGNLNSNHVSRTGLVAAAAAAEGRSIRPIPIVSCHRVMLEIRDRARLPRQRAGQADRHLAGRQAGAAWNDDCRRI